MISFLAYCVVGGLTAAVADKVLPPVSGYDWDSNTRRGVAIVMGAAWPLGLGALAAYATFTLTKSGLTATGWVK